MALHFIILTDKLIAGITQEAILTVNPGSYILDAGDELKLTTSQGFRVITEDNDSTLRVTERVKNKSVEFRVRMFQERANTCHHRGNGRF